MLIRFPNLRASILPVMFSTCLITLSLVPPTWGQPMPAAAEKLLQDPEIAQLRSHGIGLDAPSLIRLLENGLSDEVRASMPDKPSEKSQLAVYAMARLATAKSEAALPALLGIAAMNPPAGIESLLKFDTEQTSPESRTEFRVRALKLLQFNAVNALGIIGDTAALPVVRAVFQQEQHPAARIQHAISLASLGDSSGMDFLVQAIRAENRRESAAAARAFFIITGQDFGYTENTAAKVRGSKAAEYANWWKQNAANFKADRNAVAKRRYEPTPMPSFQPRNSRDLIKLSAYYFDFNNQFRTYEARSQIANAGKRLNDDLIELMNNDSEDIDVRTEAMNWYYEFNRADARKPLRSLRRAADPEVADKANALLEQIATDETNQRVPN